MLSDRGEQRWSFQTQKSVWSVSMADLDSDGVVEVLAGGDDGSVRVLDVYGRQRGSYQTSRRVHGLAAVGGQGSELANVLARSGNDVCLLNLAPGEAAMPAVPGDGEPETLVKWREPPAREAVDEEGLIELVAVGDVLLARTVEERMEVFGSEYPFEVVANLLREADLAIGNLEAPFSLGGDPLGKRFTFRTHPGHVEALAWAGFDVLSLANNHVLDFGEESLVQTMEALRAADLAYVGAGASYEEAHRPLVMEVKGRRIAFLAYAASRWKGSYELPTEEQVAFADPVTVGQDVTRTKEQADLVVVILHLGTEYQAYPDDEQVAVSRAALEAGASLVLGHHPHVVQGSEEYAGGFVAYSLGNFVFDIDMENTREGAMLRVLLGEQGVQRVESIPVRIVDDVQPQFLRGEDGLPSVESLF
jgi:poly-gamma-glutamate capsule biosynthesis protein CapA/YwtB (metallophosphatase superfamily)